MKKSLLILCLSLLVFSCSPELEEIKSPNKLSNTVPLSEAIQIGKRINRTEIAGAFLKDASARMEEKTIEETITITTGKEHPAFYILNFEGGGFTAISADRRIPPILAYSDQGTFKQTDLPDGLLLWIEEHQEAIAQIQKTATQPSAEVLQSWQEVVNVPLSANPGRTVIGPLVSAKWGQGCGYNTFCPVGTYCNKRTPTGCVATAMAQLMYYWQHPKTYKWNMMPVNKGSAETATLMKHIGDAVGMIYNDKGSGARWENINDALKNKFSYRSAKEISYNHDLIKKELLQRRPVILIGYNKRSRSWFSYKYEQGHAWICDGYMTTRAPGSFFYMNWGWEGSQNGWFAVDNWKLPNGSYNFQYNKNAVIDIKP